MRNLLLTTSAALLALAILPAAAQPPVLPPAYDVASIRIDTRGPGSSGTESRDGTYTATNVTLKDLLEQAYDIRQDLITGVPGPVDSLRFDVHAKVVDPDLAALHTLRDSQRRAMLVPILTERFHLTAHIEPRNLPVYELVLLTKTPRFPASPDQTLGSQHESTSIHNTSMRAQNTPISVFCKTLGHVLQRTVVDKTALTGIYDLDLKWSRDDVPQADPNAPPGIFTALQEQLGLKLQPAKGPVPTLVVDHVEMPTDN